MRSTQLHASVALLAALAFIPGGRDDDEPAAVEPSPFVSLFDGESLEGWQQKNGAATYRVEDGAIVGRTANGSPNSFLCTERDYSDFELRFEVKVDDALNSGCQIRSRTRGDLIGRVNGPQEGLVDFAVRGMTLGVWQAGQAIPLTRFSAKP